jgi:hypothetical protein
MSKKANDALRAKYIAALMEKFKDDEDVMRTGTGEIAFPVVDEEGEDNWVVITVKIPTGSRDGDAYDGYSMAEDYAMNVAKKETKAKEAAVKKAAKIARDEKMRKQKAAAKAEHMQEITNKVLG